MTSVYEITSELRTVSAARKAFAFLRTEYVRLVGEDQAAHSDAMHVKFHGVNFKEGGLAWWKDRARSMGNAIVHHRSTVAIRIAPSQESARWDSFEGGFIGSRTDREEEDLAVARVAFIVNAARTGSVAVV